ncbi:right-handed parallel beta-helix repeat-containing protein [Bacillus stercoris]|nr:right-handed parallel beta-helix repeat-containing protein [Bacillus stercoris]
MTEQVITREEFDLLKDQVSMNGSRIQNIYDSISPDIDIDYRKTYIISTKRWGIYKDGTNAKETTDGINNAVQWAKENGYHHIVLPQGTYLINCIGLKDINKPDRWGGIYLPSHTHFEMRPDTFLITETNGSWGYTMFYSQEEKNVLVTGGNLVGDRYLHDYTGHGTWDTKKTHEWGHAFNIVGCEDFAIDHVAMKDFTGDAIITYAKGMLHVDWTDYVPPKRIAVRNCLIDSCRRNNIALTACDGAIVENSKIINAGGPGTEENPLSAGTTPQFGIDIEGYGEGEIDYEEPWNIIIKGNYFQGNTVASVANFSGYRVIITENISDQLISYSNGTDTIISNNLFIRTDLTKTAIKGEKVSAGFDRNGVTIVGNMITGFSTGIDVRGKNITVVGNMINNIGSTGINCYDVSNALIASNYVWKSAKNGISANLNTDNVVIQGNSFDLITEVAVSMSGVSGVKVKGNNITKSATGVRVNGAKDIHIDDNIFDIWGLEGAKNEVVVEGDSDATLKGNHFVGSKGYALMLLGSDTLSPKIRMVSNHFDKAKSLILMYGRQAKTPEFLNNTVSFERTSNGGTAIYLEKTNGAVLVNNTITSLNGYKLGAAINTSLSDNSMVLRNTIINGKLMVNQNTDVSDQNIVR